MIKFTKLEHIFSTIDIVNYLANIDIAHWYIELPNGQIFDAIKLYEIWKKDENVRKALST